MTVRVAVAPDVARPRQPVTATISTDQPLGDIGSVRLEWGYDNDTEDWVCVTRVEVPVDMGEFAGTTATFTVPPWAPGSSEQIARWSCRVTVEAGGRDEAARGGFAVVIGIEDVDPVEAREAPMERVSGDAETDVEISLPASVFRAGDTVAGHVLLTARSDVPDADVAVCWQRHLESHPMLRPAAESVTLDGPIVKLGKGIPLLAGATVTVPFSLALPADADPTADAVHSSLSWSVGARMSYSDAAAHAPERVLRPIIVTNA